MNRASESCGAQAMYAQWESKKERRERKEH